MKRHTPSRYYRLLRIKTRRFLHRIDRKLPWWLAWLPSWGTSLLLHGVLVLVLATVYLASERENARTEFVGEVQGQLREDLTSLIPADQTGDPFTTNQTDLPPSLPSEGANLPTVAFNQPRLPDSVRFNDQFKLTPGLKPGLTPRLTDTIGGGLTNVEDMSAPFSGRSGPAKAELIRREGGTVQSEDAVQAGLAWIARHQRTDGGWSLDVSNECHDDGCPDAIAAESDTAATGLALLPLLGAGHSHTEPGIYQGTIKSGLDWLTSHQMESGELYTGGGFNYRMYSHAIATLALCEAYGVSKDERLRPYAQRAVDFIMESQDPNTGGWRYFPGQAGDTSVFGWMMFALRSARLAGLHLSKEVLTNCRLYLDRAVAGAKKALYAYQPGQGPTFSMTAEALLCRQYLGWGREHPSLQYGVGQVIADLDKNAQFDRNIYYWYYATQLLHNMQGKLWKRWNPKIRDTLVAMQVKGKGCDRGSWHHSLPAPDRWGRRVGRLYVTTMSILTLEVYYRYLPLYQVTDETNALPGNRRPEGLPPEEVPADKPKAKAPAKGKSQPKAKAKAAPRPGAEPKVEEPAKVEAGQDRVKAGTG